MNDYIDITKGHVFIYQPAFIAEWSFDANFDSGLIVKMLKKPNWFHRKMQTLILGIHWRDL